MITKVLSQALRAITDRINLATGLMLPKDRDSTKEMLLLPRRAGESLPADEIESWAFSHGWHHEDAAALGALAAQIRAAKKMPKMDGKYWPADIVTQFQADESR